MRIGYACLTIGVPNTDIRGCIARNATPLHLSALITHNMQSLQNMIEYNAENNIRLFRISSDIIPFGSSPINDLFWWELFQKELFTIGKAIKKHGIRVSMHPGQYTVLNSPDKKVVKQAIQDLDYHTRFLDSLHADSTSKIILHIGGIYGNKKKAVTAFCEQYKDLESSIKDRVVIENDDKLFTIHDVLEISHHLNIPVVFDHLHHAAHHEDDKYTDLDWIRKCNKTWKTNDGFQKIHYSQQNPLKKPGSHSESIRIHDFLAYVEPLKNEKLDIMLEVKDKNLSATKCILCNSSDDGIFQLEKEWSRYKYLVLEHSPVHYNQIRHLLKDKQSYPVIAFYTLIENALLIKKSTKKAINSAEHVWGYFADVASDSEKKQFSKLTGSLKTDIDKLRSLKSFLWRLTEKYKQPYLLQSYYFHKLS